MNGEVRKKNRMDFLNEGSRARQQMEVGGLTLTLALTLTLTLTLTPNPNP